MSDAIPFRRAAILGMGLIGGSFALALKRAHPETAIVGFDRPETLERAKKREPLAAVLQETTADFATAVHGADLIYVALPIVAAVEALPSIAASAASDALITDACSTKSAICRAAAEAFRGGTRFLGGHPMAGKEQSGIDHADANLFRGARYALIALETDPDLRVQKFAALLHKIGAEPVWCDADTHDWAAGVVSHLPQMVSIALARVIADETDETGLPVSLAGSGLRDALRLAASPYSVWRDICLTNTDNIARSLDRIEQAVSYLRTRLASRELEQEFHAANELYKTLHKLQ
ncbi:MAG: prephenate dehydrogenase [Candidatus Acidiferrales bacterium]